MSNPTQLIIDYACVQTQQELVAWAIDSFEMPRKLNPTNDLMMLRQFLLALFAHIGLQNRCYIVYEINCEAITAEIESILGGQRGWKHILSFHAQRDFGIFVRFEPFQARLAR